MYIVALKLNVNPPAELYPKNKLAVAGSCGEGVGVSDGVFVGVLVTGGVVVAVRDGVTAGVWDTAGDGDTAGV